MHSKVEIADAVRLHGSSHGQGQPAFEQKLRTRKSYLHFKKELSSFYISTQVNLPSGRDYMN